MTYNRSYQHKNMHWSVPNHRLYNRAFTGLTLGSCRCVPTTSRRTTPCSHACATQAVRGSGCTTTQRATPGTHHSSVCCWQYNEGKCRQTANTCRYAHRYWAYGCLHFPCSGQLHMAKFADKPPEPGWATWTPAGASIL